MKKTTKKKKTEQQPNKLFKALSGYQVKWRLFIFSVLSGYSDNWTKFKSKCGRNFIKIQKENKIFWSHSDQDDKFILENLPKGVSVNVIEITDKQFGMSKRYYGK